MVTLVRQVEQALKEIEGARRLEVEFRDLQRFYDEMKRLGLVVKQEYGLPPIDTVGRTAHQSKQ